MISCIVNNIGQYINFIEHHFKGMWNYFYRGEDNDFKNTKLTASFYRGKSKKNGVKYYYNTWSTFLNASQSFYRNLPNINKNESRNFMELCQHHAIPTPLLDISSSPLIALYFASQNRNTDGHVYIFNKNIFIPFTNDILSYKYLNKCFHNHHFPLDFHKIINIKLLIKSIRTSMFYSNVNQTNSITKLINETIYDVEGHLKKRLSATPCNYLCISQLYDELKKYNTIESLISLFDNSRDIEYKKNDIRYYYELYLEKLNITKIQMDNIENKYPYLFGFLIFFANQFNITTQFNGQFIPKYLNLYVSSTVNWDRIRSQKSKFILQIPYLLNNISANHYMMGGLKDTSIMETSSSIVHKPVCDLEFTIPNYDKEFILRELDALGVNEMTIFRDKDNTAKYIRNKYYI